eukprot:Skav233170  [mRNA]  locus=scaffold24:56123:57932:+ [translate_table: standard]
MMALHHDLLQSHTSLQRQHADLMKAHKAYPGGPKPLQELLEAFKHATFNGGGAAQGSAAKKKQHVMDCLWNSCCCSADALL